VCGDGVLSPGESCDIDSQNTFYLLSNVSNGLSIALQTLQSLTAFTIADGVLPNSFFMFSNANQITRTISFIGEVNNTLIKFFL
jgi:hypothetical protein